MTSPTTPAGAYTSAPSTPTGSWRHPAICEIARKRSQHTFTDASLKIILANSAALISTFALTSIIDRSSLLSSVYYTSSPYSTWILIALRILFLWNVGDHISRLFRTADEFSDMALTPEQRRLLGLNPDTPLSTKVQPTDFVTPPRYVSIRNNSPLLGGPGSGSPTLQRKGLLGGAGSESPLGSGVRKELWGSPAGGVLGGSPKSAGSGSSVVPGNRWAYEKSILQRKGDGMRASPSKNLFGTPR